MRQQSVKAGAFESGHFFRYTSGRWLVDEQAQLAKRYVTFNLQALKHGASCALQSPCIQVAKLPEGLYNKVLSLRMENGKEVLAKIPNPNAGHPRSVVASEVATLDFLRNELQIPVPRVIEWSLHNHDSTANLVGAEFMLMEKVPGRQLSDVWPTMSEAERFGLVKSIVRIENKLTDLKLSKYGSIYYRDNCPDGLTVEQVGLLDDRSSTSTSGFVIGPVADRHFWPDEKEGLDIDRGPWDTSEAYFSAVAKCEIAKVRRNQHQNISLPLESNAILIQLLEQFLQILPYILPPGKDITRPVLLHGDLHSKNIFVDDTDPTQVSGVIDWQGIWAAPLFTQARVPSVFETDGPYTWGAVEPKLPDDYHSLSESDQQWASEKLSGDRLKKFYELASRKYNPLLTTALDAMRREDDPTTFLFHIIQQAWLDGPVPLRQVLVQVYEKWDLITQRRGIQVPCPISFTEDQIREANEQAEEWAVAFNEFDALRSQVVGKDGWVSHEEYAEAMAHFNAHKDELEELRKKLHRFGGAGLLC
ncbi:hypothetical protein DV738_g3782, partial [Chaetothyriales sp. CBS 135597]